MRVLHIDTATTWRGGQNQVLLTALGLSAAGLDVRLAAHERGELAARAANRADLVPFAPRSEVDVRAGWQLGRALQDLEPDVVHAHDPMAVALAAMALRMAPPARRPLVVAARRVDFHLKRHAFSRWKYASVDVFIAASALIASVLERDGIEPERIEVVHDGVDLTTIDAVAPVDLHGAFWLPHGAPVVGNVAALVPHKGQRHLIDAAARVVRALPDVRFVIVGAGELQGDLERQIAALGLERHVQLTGFRRDVLGLMKSLDLFVMSSVTEGLGSAVLEAMSCRRAVVATRAGGIPEIVVDQVTGRLVPPHDDEALADAIEAMLRDEALRARCGAAGRARVEDAFGVDRLVRETRRVYDSHLPRVS